MPASVSSPDALARPPLFTEVPAWGAVGSGWQRVFGGFRSSGFSVEWHDFTHGKALDWGASFHPQGVELCLNLVGHGVIQSGRAKMEFTGGTAGFYAPLDTPLSATRAAGEPHQFLTVEYSRPFLATHLGDGESKLHPLIRAFIDGKTGRPVLSGVKKLTIEQEQIITTLRQPPVYAAAHALWYQCKALELAVAFFFDPEPEEELFCTRQQRLARERSEQVVFLLRQNLAQPPTLDEMAKKIGCSPFHLSRIFSTETGQTITHCLRRLRLEKAAEMLASKEYSVTEVALEVGYNSLSHFSQAFSETYGCCPGLYPLATSTQQALRRTRRAGK